MGAEAADGSGLMLPASWGHAPPAQDRLEALVTHGRHHGLSRSIGALLALVLVLATGCGDDDSGPSVGDGGDYEAGTGGGDGGTAGSGEAGAGGAGTGGSSADAGAGGIEVAGSWSSDFGDETIDDTMWNGASIVSFDNAANEVITQDPPSEDDAGVEIDGAFNKIVWTEVEGDAFYYCWVSFGQPTAADADANAMAFDDSDPDTGGCGDSDFPWTKLERM
jgi:hypothetical protein